MWEKDGRKARAGRKIRGHGLWKHGGLKTDMDAYFTVEAAMVVPVAIGIIVLSIYLSFFLYDRCVLAQDLYLLSYRQGMEKGDADRAGQEAAREELHGKLFMLSRLETGVSSGGTLVVRGRAQMNARIPWVDKLQGKGDWAFGEEGKARKTDPPRDFRRVRRLLNLASLAVR